MTLIKYLILGTLEAITSILPISSELHFFIFNKVFNTQIFTLKYYNFFSNFGLLCSLIIIFFKETQLNLKHFSLKKIIKNYKKTYFPILNIILISIAIFLIELFLKKLKLNLKLTIIVLIINSILLLTSNCQKNSKSIHELKLPDSIFIIILITIGLYLRIPYFTLFFFTLTKLKFSKKDSLLLSFFFLIFPLFADFINNFSTTLLINTSTYYLVEVICTIIISLLTYKYIKQKIFDKKLHIFSIYCIIIAIFLIIWFR